MIELREIEKDALLKMDEGYILLAGCGIFGIHCLLMRGGDKVLLHRSSFMRLRNAGLVRYRDQGPPKEGKKVERLDAHLTTGGRKLVRELREKKKELVDAGLIGGWVISGSEYSRQSQRIV